MRIVLFGTLIVSIRLQFVGSTSYTPVLFTQLYLLLFTFAFVLMPMLVKSGAPSSSVYLIGPVGFAVAWYASALAPTMGEKNVCTMIASSSHVPPHSFHCTSLPYGLAAFVVVWWFGIALIERRMR